jgi:hypothetical protein
MDLVPRPTVAEYSRIPRSMVLVTAPARDRVGPRVYGFQKPARPQKYWVETDSDQHAYAPRAINHV